MVSNSGGRERERERESILLRWDMSISTLPSSSLSTWSLFLLLQLFLWLDSEWNYHLQVRRFDDPLHPRLTDKKNGDNLVKEEVALA